MNYKKFTKFISFFLLIVILLSFFVPNFDNDDYLAGTIKKAETTETTQKKRNVGHKIEGAHYYDELYDKYRIIAVDNGGGSGAGGGAGGDEALTAGNGGDGNSSGGIGGVAAGTGTGMGNAAVGGKGGATTGVGNGYGSSGSAVLDALRDRKAKEESAREESIAEVLETADNQIEIRESIEKKEKELESIQKEIAKESIKAKIYGETVSHNTIKPEKEAIFSENIIAPTKKIVEEENTHIIPTNTTYVDELNDIRPTSNVVYSTEDLENTLVPTNSVKEIVESSDDIMPTYKEETTYETQNTLTPTTASTEYINQYEEINNIVPTANQVITIYDMYDITEPQTKTYDAVETVPVKVETMQQTEIYAPTSATEVYVTETAYAISDVGPGDFIENTTEYAVETVYQEVVKEFIEETNKITQVENEMPETVDNKEKGSGSKGGNEANKKENKEGDSYTDESMGMGQGHGKFQSEREGDHSGKKVFELDRNGFLGIDENKTRITNLHSYMWTFSVLVFVFGFLLYFISTRDKKSRKNYF